MRLNEATARLAADASDAAMDDVILAGQRSDATDEEISVLAQVLAASGETRPRSDHEIVADVASTGGPSSLSTLLCPLFLRCLGADVPKIGVPGRPAGAVDVMATIPGYRVILTRDEVAEVLAACGLAHVLATGRQAPLDGRLFARRRLKGATAVPALAIASLLSKKIAVGVRLVGLDVRIGPHGNFGDRWSDARENAQRFVRVASLLGIKAVCFLTNASTPSQPYIGRGEALLALAKLLDGAADEWLNDHAFRCFLMARTVLGNRGAALPGKSELHREFCSNLESQGSGFSQFLDRVSTVMQTKYTAVDAKDDGFFSVDLQRLRQEIVAANERCGDENAVAGRFADVAGVVLRKRPGTFVMKGDVLADVRSPDRVDDLTSSALFQAFHVSPAGGETHGYEEV